MSTSDTNCRKFPLRGVLIVPFVLQIFTVVGLTGYLSIRQGQKAVNDVASQLRSEITARVNLYLVKYLNQPFLMHRIKNDDVKGGRLNLQNLRQVERYLLSQLIQFDSIFTNIYGNEKGDFVVAAQFSGELSFLVADKSDKTLIYEYASDRQGKRTKLLRTFHQPPAPQRPWYKAAVSAGKPTWTKPFLLGTKDDLSIGATQPIYSESGKLLGVFSSNFSLFAEISVFLNSIKVSKSGQVFIIEPSGLLVATSTKEPIFTLSDNPEGFKRLNASESKTPLISETAKYVSWQNKLTKIAKPLQLDFGLEGRRQFVQVLPFQDDRGLDWLVVVVVPEADFMQEIDANTRTTILLCAIALILASILGILTSEWIAQPIGRINTAASAIASGNFNQNLSFSSVKELAILADSFNQMSHQIKHFYAQLADYSQFLQQKVEERTEELARANQEITALNELLKTENIRMAAELEVTRRLQQMILPKDEELSQIDGLEISGFMEPANEVGGDYYDVLRQNDLVKICIGDVTGHGLESGVLAIMVQTAVRALLESNLTDSKVLLEVLNRTIYQNLQRMNSPKNLTFSILECDRGLLTLSGQHEEMIVARADGKIERINTIDLGFPIGLEANISDFVAEIKIKLNLGDVAVLYTDGITEAENMNRVQYGLERLIKAIAINGQHSAIEIKTAIIEDLRRHIGTQKIYDDITLVVLKKIGTGD